MQSGDDPDSSIFGTHFIKKTRNSEVANSFPLTTSFDYIVNSRSRSDDPSS